MYKCEHESACLIEVFTAEDTKVAELKLETPCSPFRRSELCGSNFLFTFKSLL